MWAEEVTPGFTRADTRILAALPRVGLYFALPYGAGREGLDLLPRATVVPYLRRTSNWLYTDWLIFALTHLWRPPAGGERSL